MIATTMKPEPIARELQSRVANKLRALRECADLSQAALSRESGVSQQMIARIELGLAWPSDETVARLSVAFDCDPSEFFVPPLA